jgi:hypothetical protein
MKTKLRAMVRVIIYRMNCLKRENESGDKLGQNTRTSGQNLLFITSRGLKNPLPKYHSKNTLVKREYC